MMRVDPRVVDLGWGAIKSAIATLKDGAFAASADAPSGRRALLEKYTAAFRQVEAGAPANGVAALKELSAQVTSHVSAGEQHAIASLVDAQIARLS
jgi:hypothetical protein